MKKRTPANPDAVFNRALEKARSVIDELWKGNRTPDYFHRVHIDPSGEVIESVSTSHSRDPDEYFKRTPHPLTLWEIEGRQETFEPEERLGDYYYLLKTDFTSERGISKNEDEWSDSDGEEFIKQCVEAYKDCDDFAYVDYETLEKKRAEFDQWAEDNLA